MTNEIRIPDEKKRKGWRRTLWGYTWITLPSGTSVEVDAFPGETFIFIAAAETYAVYALGWWRTLLWVNLVPIAGFILICFLTVLYRVIPDVWTYRKEVRANEHLRKTSDLGGDGGDPRGRVEPPPWRQESP